MSAADLKRWVQGAVCALAAASIIEDRAELHELAQTGARQLDNLDTNSVAAMSGWIEQAAAALDAIQEQTLALRGRQINELLITHAQ